MAKNKTMAPRPELAEPHRVALADPWMRFAGGDELCREIERGDEQAALWRLADGLAPPAGLLGAALCAAAYQGMRKLCVELERRGAPIESKEQGPRVRESLYGVWDRQLPPGSQAVLGGHLELAEELAARHGDAAYGKEAFQAEGYVHWATGSRLLSERLGRALASSRARMSIKELAAAANMLCVAGRVDEALAILDEVPNYDKERVAKAMMAPLAAYPASDPMREVAWIGLERAAQFCPGRHAPATAPWAPHDVSAFAGGRYGNGEGDIRLGCVESVVGSGRLRGRWSDVFDRKETRAWPRVAAALCGNDGALGILAAAPWSAEEVGSMARSANMVLALLDGKLRPEQLPSLMGPSALSCSLPAGYDARGWAHRALAMAEGKEIEVISKEGARKGKKAIRRQAREEGVAFTEPARSRSRL